MHDVIHTTLYAVSAHWHVAIDVYCVLHATYALTRLFVLVARGSCRYLKRCYFRTVQRLNLPDIPDF
jgi:hypothetical protein